VEEIAERADVTRKTAFNHYARKRDFIGEWGRRRRQQVLDALSPVLMAESQLDVVLRHYFAELAAINLDQRALTICMSAGWRESGGPFDEDPHELIQVFRGFIQEAADRGEISTAVDAARMATVLYSSYFGLLYDWCEGAVDVPPFNLNEAFTQLLDVVLAGLRSL
jgi:AcrR family transcriptional regulator